MAGKVSFNIVEESEAARVVKFKDQEKQKKEAAKFHGLFFFF